jgi:hypothetical protein
MSENEILFGVQLDEDNAVIAAKTPDEKFLLACRTAGVDGGAKFTPAQAAALGLSLLARNLDAAMALSATSDPAAVVELGLALLAPHQGKLAEYREHARMAAALPPGTTH